MLLKSNYNFFIHVVCHDWSFYHVLATCSACLIWPIYSYWFFLLFSNQRLLEWFLWHYTDKEFYDNFDMCSQTSHLCHSSWYVHVVLYCLDWIFYHMFVTCCACIIWPTYSGLCAIFQPEVVGMVVYGITEIGTIKVSATCVVSPVISGIVHVMFMLCSPVQSFSHVFVTCCACIIWQLYNNLVFLLFSNQWLLEWFLWHDRGRYCFNLLRWQV